MYSFEEALVESTRYFNNNKLAAEVFIGKYALRDNDNNLLEKSPKDMHRRIAKELARIEKNKFKNPLSEDEIFAYLDEFKQIIPQGSPMFGIGNYQQYISLSNCFVVTSPVDSYGGIHKTDEELTQISKRRGGVGLDLSNLRPADSPTSNSSRVSTGIGPFMERYSNSIREVGQGNRRGALMLTLSVHHPEILTFCKIKNDKTKVTGANISVKLTDEFLDAVKEDREYEQRWPIEGKPQISKMVSAKQIWKEIIKNAHATAEPGIVFWDNIIKESPADCYSNVNPSYKTVCLNPCQPTSAPVIIKGKGLSTFGELREGDEIWSETEWTKVLKKWSTGIKEVYKYTTDKFCNEMNENCYFLGTKTHKVVQNKEKIEVHQATHIDCFQDTWIDTRYLTDCDDFTIARNTYSDTCKIIKTEYIGEKEVFDITVDNEPHTYWTGGCNVSNCAELPLCEHDSCRLLVINVFSCIKNPYTNKAELDLEKLTHLSKIAQRFMDNIVDLELEHIDRIIKKIEQDPEDASIKDRELGLWHSIKTKCESGRRTGTGITALGDTLAALNIKYGSEQSIEITGLIYKTIKLGAYESSVDMAEELGPFGVWNPDLEKTNPFLLRIREERPELYERMQKYGRRNIALLTTAPTGSTSLLAKLINRFGCSSGIEPVFQYEYIRRRKINPGDDAKVDFVDQNGDKWTEYSVYHSGLEEWMESNPDKPKEESPYKGACAEDLDWQFRVKLQGAAQKHVDHSISSTINLPEDVSEDEVATIYESAWAEGLKGVTVYRKNCRTGVLVDKNKPKESIQKTSSPKRPQTLPCEVHHINVMGKKYMVFVGLLNNEPYEIMAYEGNYEGEKKGFIKKIKRGVYRATLGETIIESITDRCQPEEEAITRLVSTSLRHGADIQFVVHQLEKTGGHMTSFAKCLARTLKKYIADGAKVSGEECPNCSSKLIRQEGCMKCVSCQFSKCG